jgi:hypothetical protein
MSNSADLTRKQRANALNIRALLRGIGYGSVVDGSTARMLFGTLAAKVPSYVEDGKDVSLATVAVVLARSGYDAPVVQLRLEGVAA